MDKTLFYLAKKEIMDNVRNLWIILVTLIFTALALMVSFFGSMGQGWQSLEFTVIGLRELVKYLIPIIGLMLGYAAIIREIETGSMSSLLSHPIKRCEVILGKFIGLGFVLSFCIFIGFGISGIIIGLNINNPDYISYLVFIFVSILLGLVFLSISMFFSSIIKTRAASMGLSIFFWFFFVILWLFVIVGIGFAFGNNESYAIDLFNPITPFFKLVDISQNMLGINMFGMKQNLPSYYTSETMYIITFLWIIIPNIITIFVFRRRDI
jgi:Cu-processing system permease protein